MSASRIVSMASIAAIFWGLGLPQTLEADPCGMVPPIYAGQGVPIKRIGFQETYVFFQNGVESIAIRPGFEGKVEEFGMLIPFPNRPVVYDSKLKGPNPESAGFIEGEIDFGPRDKKENSNDSSQSSWRGSWRYLLIGLASVLFLLVIGWPNVRRRSGSQARR